MSKRNLTKQAAAIAALDSGSKPAGQIAESLNVSRATLYNWKKRAQTDQELSDLIQLERQELAGKYFQLASGLASALIEKLPDATFENKAVSALATAADKWLALTGQPQQITESRVSGSINLLVEARQALRMYEQEGFAPADALECLRDDDPELYRALLTASHTGDQGGESAE